MSWATVRVRSPRSAAAAPVSPTEATSGSVNITCGTIASSASARYDGSSPRDRATIASPHTRAWYLPWWVSSTRPFTSPAACSHGTPSTRMLSSTGT